MHQMVIDNLDDEELQQLKSFAEKKSISIEQAATVIFGIGIEQIKETASPTTMMVKRILRQSRGRS